jgi:hypothetical protein
VPYSAAEGKTWATAHLVHHFRGRELEAIRFLDIGCGAGLWLDVIKPSFPNSIWTGIEVWEPYVERFRLRERYDEIIVDDARDVHFPLTDVVIWGDVLEHMSEDDAVTNYERSLFRTYELVIGSVPIIHYPQGAEEGNPYEVHVQEHITKDKLHDLFDMDYVHIGETVATWVSVV